jgi:two-component system chemotaxis response regulator CheB
MGSDGKLGAARVREAGGSVVVQDQVTSVVWGMPGAVASAGLADEILPLDRIAETILRRLTGPAGGPSPVPSRTSMLATGGVR